MAAPKISHTISDSNPPASSAKSTSGSRSRRTTEPKAIPATKAATKPLPWASMAAL